MSACFVFISLFTHFIYSILEWYACSSGGQRTTFRKWSFTMQPNVLSCQPWCMPIPLAFERQKNWEMGDILGCIEKPWGLCTLHTYDYSLPFASHSTVATEFYIFKFSSHNFCWLCPFLFIDWGVYLNHKVNILDFVGCIVLLQTTWLCHWAQK